MRPISIPPISCVHKQNCSHITKLFSYQETYNPLICEQFCLWTHDMGGMDMGLIEREMHCVASYMGPVWHQKRRTTHDKSPTVLRCHTNWFVWDRQYTLKRILYTLQRTCYKLKRALYIPVYTKKSLIHTQKSPIRVQHRNVEPEQSEETLMGGTHCNICNILQHIATHCITCVAKMVSQDKAKKLSIVKALYTLESPLYTHQSHIHT